MCTKKCEPVPYCGDCTATCRLNCKPSICGASGYEDCGTGVCCDPECCKKCPKPCNHSGTIVGTDCNPCDNPSKA